MIPHRPKRQDVAIPFQGNNRKTDPAATADQAVHMAANQPPVIISDHSAPLVLSADAPIYSLIATVVAEDPDGNDIQLTYRIIAGNADNQFYIADDSISVTGRGRDIYLFPNALNINAASRHVLTIEVSDGVNTVTANITIDIDTATADIGITANAGADLTALEAGDVITGSIMTADPDGVAPNTDVTWRWFHHGNPAVTIATGTSYAITSFDWGKQIGLELIYVDANNVATQTQSHSFALTEPVTRPDTPLTTTAPLRGDDTDILADYLLGWQPFARPDSGAVTITWKLDKISLAADIVRPLLEQAFASFAKYININFVETQDYSANILLNFLPSSLNPRVGGIAEAEGNHRVLSFFLDAINFTDTANHQKATSRLILHELGHALGLKHPFHAAPEKYKQGDDLWPYHAPFISNTHTIMSYDSSGEKDIFETLKSADIIALQRLYGKAPNTDTIDENRNNVFTAITFDITGLDISSLTWDITGQGADQFLVERHDGAYTLKIIQSLDYEMITRYDLIVTATDGNANQVEQAVSIIVADKNDNTPSLAFHDASSVTGRIVESTRQTGVIFTVSNLDSADIITWSISGNGADNFILERDGVLYRLVLKPDAVLDINAVHDYDLTVTVTDGQFISRPVAVRVTNQNIAPHFTSDHSAPVMLAENSPGGWTLVTRVTATDPENATLIYRIISGNDDNLFLGSLLPYGYDIRVHPEPNPGAELDFETAETHILTVEVSDGVNKLTTTITIQVTDQNDNAPVLTASGTGMVSENISGALTGITFNISDADTDAVNRFLWHHFTITGDVATDPNNSLGSQFEIRAINDIWSLKLKKTASLDYETLPNSGVITLQVTVSDGLNISAPVTVQVQVNDVNGPPVFSSESFAVTVDHMAEYGALIYRLPILYDEDHSLTYRITAGNTGNIFAIDHMGKITLAASLDEVAIDSVYQLTVSVSDGQGGMDTATIDIRVIKILDMVTIWENHPLSKPAAMISLPADLTGATMRLADDQPDNAFFRIDANGQIWWLATPDFEMPKDADADNIYMAEIIFTKNGVDSRGFVNIQVGDIGPGRSVYDPITRPDGDGRVHAILRADGEPGGLANYLLGYDAYTHPVNHPATEPLILTWAMNENIYPAHITRPWMHWAFSAFEAAINIRFIEVEYHTDTDMRPDLEINFIEESGGGAALVHGDNRKIYLHRRQNPQGEFSPVLVGDQHKTLLHEIGHALGLKHPFEALSGKDWPADAADATRFNPDTIMSYYISLDRGLRHLKLADVAALQFLYGVPEYQGTITENHIGVETGIAFNLTADILSSATWAIAGTDADKFEMVWGQANWILKLKSGQSLDFDIGDTRILTITLVNDDYDFVGIRATITVMDVNDLDVPMKARDNDITLSDTATEVDAGDGSDIITVGAGNDQITGGKGDDQIDLGAGKADTDKVIYKIGGRAANDGGDTVTNFNRGVDQFVFALENNADTAGITDYDSFIRFITKGTATLDDDEFMVQLDLGEDANGNTQLEGLFFHFAGSSVFSGGRVSLPLMKISFAEPVDTAGIAGILTDDAGQAVNPGQVVNPYWFVTDFDYLDDFLGGAASIDFSLTTEVI